MVDQRFEIETLTAQLMMNQPVERSIHCAIEEMSELTQVLCKALRGSEKFTQDRLTEELAHAQLMLDGIQCIFLIPKQSIDDEKLLALNKALKPKTEIV